MRCPIILRLVVLYLVTSLTAACAASGQVISTTPAASTFDAGFYAASTPALEASLAAGMPRLPAFFVGVNVYDLAADPPTGYQCNAPTGWDASTFLDQTFAVLKANGVQVIRFWAFQTYGTNDQTGERYWGGFDSVMAKGLQYGIYVIPVLENRWPECARLRPFTARLARRVSSVSSVQWAEQFAERYGNAPAVYAFEVVNEPTATNQSDAAIGSLRDDLKQRVDAVKAHTAKPVGLGNIGEDEPGFDSASFHTTYAFTGATIATSHDYQGWHAVPGSCGLDANQCHDLADARDLGLVFYFGEGGSKSCDGEQKAAELRQKLQRAQAAGAAGYLYWDFSLLAPATNCGFDIGPDGAVISVFRDFETRAAESWRP